jgi:hypothetical protein
MSKREFFQNFEAGQTDDPDDSECQETTREVDFVDLELLY